MELSHQLKKTPEFIFDYLTDMQKFASVHPVISQIDKLDTDSYLVHETLKLGFIPVSFSYPVKIKKIVAERSVIMQATVMKMTKIELSFTIKQEKDYTVVAETIQFKSPLPVKSIMKNIFRKQHDQLFKNIALVTN